MPAAIARHASELIERVRERRPRIHCITNTVAQAFTANALLAVGAVPSMTTAPEEIADFVAGADGLLVNLGTLEADRRKVIRTAIETAAEKDIAWLLDPVFIDRSPQRRGFAHDLAALAPRSVLHVHLHEAALTGADAVARVEGLGPAPLSALCSLLSRTKLTVRPVRDLSSRVRSIAYEHPESLKEHVYLTTGGDYWPFATSTSPNRAASSNNSENVRYP